MYHEPSSWHTFLGYEEDVRNTMLYTPPAAEYGDKLSWDDFCIRSDEKEFCIEALYQAYIYNKIKKDYINKALKELCKYLGHNYVKWKEDTNYLCKCPNCGSVKKVSSDIYYHNKKRRIINPGSEIEDYINYVSSINISDLSNIDKKDFVINDDYFKDPKMPRHLKLGELIKI